MFRHIAAGTAIAIAVTLTPSLAQAQQLLCGARDKILTKLGTDYAESQVSLGLASNGNLLEVMASPGGTWTMIFTKPEGGSCILATGRSWEKLTPVASNPTPPQIQPDMPLDIPFEMSSHTPVEIPHS